MLIGYARVSTQDQNLELQTAALTRAGCKKIFEDKVTGSRAERPGLTKAQEALREGDTLVVWKLDRLGPKRQEPSRSRRRASQRRRTVQKPHGLNRYWHAVRTVFLSRDGQSGPDGTRTYHRTNPRRTRSCPEARPQRWPKTADDRQQDQISQKASRERSTASRCGQ
jgi:hypothetical protein